jgi:2,4-diketo-3-deoxy-L-fuconate hydrolase
LINTGTPAGVGMGLRPQVWLKAGDVMEVGIEGLGTQRQTVIPADSAANRAKE